MPTDVVPGVGFEPTCPLGPACLRRLRIPFRHPGLHRSGCYRRYDAVDVLSCPPPRVQRAHRRHGLHRDRPACDGLRPAAGLRTVQLEPWEVARYGGWTTPPRLGERLSAALGRLRDRSL